MHQRFFTKKTFINLNCTTVILLRKLNSFLDMEDTGESKIKIQMYLIVGNGKQGRWARGDNKKLPHFGVPVIMYRQTYRQTDKRPIMCYMLFYYCMA